jgi:hypothetical protein
MIACSIYDGNAVNDIIITAENVFNNIIITNNIDYVKNIGTGAYITKVYYYTLRH